MDLRENHIESNRKKIIRYLYLISLFFLVLTGFGQMPVFKRYYIADIPGLGWLAQFFVTHYMHYLFAILFFWNHGIYYNRIFSYTPKED